MKKPGFSLIELVLVVLIIGVIGAIAVPRLSSASENSKYSAVHAGFRNIGTAMDSYYMDHRVYPNNAHVGRMPDGMEGYIQPNAFSQAPAIGGGWDWNGPGSGINHFGINLSIHKTTKQERIEMERRFDDGDKNTGLYRNQSHYLIWPVGP